jgi:pimeloyl-ACP methyl ester carboxylesterase
MTFRVPNDEIITRFEIDSIPIEIIKTTYNDREFQYFEATLDSSESKPILLFVHGSPGSSDDFRNFLSDKELLKMARLISVDRFGYGHSGYGESEPSLKKQAAQLHHLLSLYEPTVVIATGHSFGGPIIMRLAIDYPEDLDALVLVGPALDPKNEKYKGIAKFGKWKVTKWMVSKSFQVAADEKIAHVRELDTMESEIPNIRIPVKHIHGKKDKIVPYKNVDYSKKHFDSGIIEILTLEDSGHFLLNEDNYPIVKKEIMDLLEELFN